MSNSYRIRTDVGKDKSVKVLLDQDFEYLEILSLKILQNQIYTRPCSDYGVIVGRVSVNNGFGLPNAKISVFIPLDQIDSENAVISDLYPYKITSDVNDDGYRYNLLPYKQQHGGHTPTGTFFTREDVLVEPTLIQVFDKYYKYTARTNDSGDYMIFGVPVGPQNIHMDIDLSDIGEFSLSPQDLIRMGKANESQVAGTKFRASTNLSELPQIVSIDKTIEVEPLWGQPDICSLGITRTDFDLTQGLNIKIEPTAIFMGSLISNKDDFSQKRNCKPKLKSGQMCSLTTGPGEIIAIRQTINQDTQGRPALEVFDLDSGGQVIDENGTWLVDVPMNLDYVVTNEFGQQVLSDDPNKGIPTKGRYRFKVKWNQPPTLRTPIKRGYFLVPNIREYGWTNATNDPFKFPYTNYSTAIKSYAFSLDWNDYADPQTAINCEDTFYNMSYNKVYTVAQHMTQYRNGFQRARYLSIKNILDDTCESENYRFPTNDAQYRFDLLFLLFRLAMFVFRPILIIIVILLHVLAWFFKAIGPLLGQIIYWFCRIWGPVCDTLVKVINKINSALNTSFPTPGPCPGKQDCKERQQEVENMWKRFSNIKIPNLTYPDCELCDCGDDTSQQGPGFNPNSSPSGPPIQTLAPAGSSTLSQFYLSSNYNDLTIPLIYQWLTDPNLSVISAVMAGQKNSTASNRVPQPTIYDVGGPQGRQAYVFTTSLNIAERFNLFNTKAKFFNNIGGNNPGGGVNQIQATFNYPANGSNFHYDNIIALSCQAGSLSTFPIGGLVTFQDPSLSKDVNLTGFTNFNQFNTPSITGTTLGNQTINVTSANPNGGSVTTSYIITGTTADDYLKFPIDIEYYQVITAMTISNYLTSSNPTPFTDSFKERTLLKDMRFYLTDIKGELYDNNLFYSPSTQFNNFGSEVLVFLVRGVDPHSNRQPCRYDLSKIFGYNSFGQVVVTGNYKLNIPIQPGFLPTDHSTISGNIAINNDTSGLRLFYPSYQFQPNLTGQASFTGFTTDMATYYSSLGNGSGCSYLPNNPPTSNLGAASQCTTPNGLRVDNNASFLLGTLFYKNGFRHEFPSPVTKNNCYSFGPPFVTNSTSNPTSNNSIPTNRGYYESEIVEGGSLMVQYVTFNNIFGIPNSGCGDIDLRGYYYSSYYSGLNLIFQTGNLGVSQRQIVMRADRLPTSTSTQILDGNSYALLQNSDFAIFNLDDSGTSTQNGGGSSTNLSNPIDDQLSNVNAQIFASFTCPNLVPLGCYYTQPNGDPGIRPSTDSCFNNGVDGTAIMKNGCYILVTVPLKTLTRDLKLLAEWFSRTTIIFGACRNVWSHLFTNNWINGTLFAFPINNDRFFTGVNVSPTNPVTIDGVTYTKPNFPYSKYCQDTVVLDRKTNNYYYRSCPYITGATAGFIGAPAPQPPSIAGSNTYGGNQSNILFPTTIVDLGPRSFYLQELVMSDNFDGYVVNKLNSTTFNDVDEILNLLIINRLINTKFIQFLLGVGNTNILRFFSRDQSAVTFVNHRMTDADYAQAISVNSELGVAPFLPENYPSTGQIFFNGGDADDAIFGIQFSSDTQVRDWITPKRTIINSSVPVTSPCAFNYYESFSQEVPFYNWTILNNTSTNPGPPNPNSIWGSQLNEWYTIPNINSNSRFFSFKYQSMDRISAFSRYFRTNNNNQTDYFKGYIYGIDNTGNLSPLRTNWNTNSPIADAVTVGAPFHFYFGLKQGASAWDRFAKKWVGFETIEN